MGSGVPRSHRPGHALSPSSRRTLPPTPPGHLLVPHSAPRHTSSQPHLQSAPSKRTWLDLLVTRHGAASLVTVALTAAQADASRQKPMQQGPSGHQQPSAFAHSGAPTLTVALYHPAFGDTRPSDAQTAAVGLTSEPPRTPTVQSHIAPGHCPPSSSPREGVGWGRGASESQMLFLGSPESLPADSTPGAVWPGVAKPQVCPRRLPGGASLKAVVGEPTQDSGHHPGAPARPLPQMGLEF